MLKRLLILALLACSLAVVAPAAPAFAQTCVGDTHRVTRTLYQATVMKHDGRVINMDGSLEVVVCPNGSNATIVRPKNIRWCFDIQGSSGPTALLEEYRFNSYIQDNNEVVNPSTFTVQAENRNEFCATQLIGDSIEKWLERSQNARWNAWCTVVYGGATFDDENELTAGAHTL